MEEMDEAGIQFQKTIITRETHKIFSFSQEGHISGHPASFKGWYRMRQDKRKTPQSRPKFKETRQKKLLENLKKKGKKMPNGKDLVHLDGLDQRGAKNPSR